VNDPLVLWKLPMYVAAAKVVACNEKNSCVDSSSQKNLAAKSVSHSGENHNCGINRPERETTETSHDLHGTSERMEAVIYKESYATSTIQASEYEYIC
jgi:hypothetical protein